MLSEKLFSFFGEGVLSSKKPSAPNLYHDLGTEKCDVTSSLDLAKNVTNNSIERDGLHLLFLSYSQSRLSESIVKKKIQISTMLMPVAALE